MNRITMFETKKAFFLCFIWVVVVVSLLFLIGCSTKEVIYQNQTTERIINNSCAEVIPCPDLNCAEIPDCVCNQPECKPQGKTIYAEGCTTKLNLCTVRLDYMNDRLSECYITNSSQYVENISNELTRCKYDLNITEKKLDEIRGMV